MARTQPLFENRRGYFFLIDAVLALTILGVGLFVVFNTHITTPSEQQVESISEDLMDYFSRNKIHDLNNPYVGIGGTLWDQGIISNGDSTLMQQIAELYYRGNKTVAQKIVANISFQTVPDEFAFEFWIDNDLLFPLVADDAHNLSKNSSITLAPAREIVFGVVTDDPSQLFGPYAVEVLAWQRS